MNLNGFYNSKLYPILAINFVNLENIIELNLKSFIFLLFHYYSDNNNECIKYLSNSLQYNSSLLSLKLSRFFFHSFIIIQVIILIQKVLNIYQIHYIIILLYYH